MNLPATLPEPLCHAIAEAVRLPEPADGESPVADWVARFGRLATIIRAEGWDRRLHDVTIGRPMDQVVLQALRSACRAAQDGGDPTASASLMEICNRLWMGEVADRERFHQAVHRVLQRLTAYGW